MVDGMEIMGKINIGFFEYEYILKLLVIKFCK